MRESLGEFEQLVPLAVVQIGDDVYGVPIVVLKGCATYLETALKGWTTYSSAARKRAALRG